MQSKIRCNQPVNAILFTTLLCIITALIFDIRTLGDLASIPGAMCFFFCFGAVIHRRHRPTDKFLIGSDLWPSCFKCLSEPKVHMVVVETVCCVVALILLFSCEPDPNTPSNYLALNTSFAHWANWELHSSLLNCTSPCSQVQGK